MKKILYLIIILGLGLGACKKSSLDLIDPNDPALSVLQTEEGIKRAALGIYAKFGLDYWWRTLQYHDIMGDAYFASVGNFSWRWANQPTSITLSNGTVLTPPQGGAQGVELRNRNARAFTEDNAFQYEWKSMYLVNNQANLLLASLENDISFGGDADVKKKVLTAWAYWWKGFAYSRVGSIYISGIISNVLNQTNSDFVPYSEILDEANRNFDLAAAALQGLAAAGDYTSFLRSILPSFTIVGKGGVLTPEEWIRNINTYKARNILVNKHVEDLTTADLQAILTLTENGIRSGDKTFTMRSALQNDLVGETSWQPYRSSLTIWSHISERLIQDYKTGDERFIRNFTDTLVGYPIVNAQGRGFNYSTRWGFIAVEDGGDFSTIEPGRAEITIAGAYEENQLMRAEAFIRSGQIEDGLALIDEVRTYQEAELPITVGLGLDEDAALEELRRERRVGLLNKNVAYYDARRWGILKPVSEGGGRTGAVVVYIPDGQTAFQVDNNATINYNYLDRWDVPANELDFNEPASGSAPVVSPK